jgi:hypothetical protein
MQIPFECPAPPPVVYQPPKLDGKLKGEDSSAFGKLGAVVARASIDRFDAEDRSLDDRQKATLASLGRPWEYPSDYNVWRMLKRQRGRRPADEWKTQQWPDFLDLPLAQNNTSISGGFSPNAPSSCSSAYSRMPTWSVFM